MYQGSNFEKVFTPLGRSLTHIKVSDKRPEVIAAFIIAEILVTAQLSKNVLDHKRKKEVLAL